MVRRLPPHLRNHRLNGTDSLTGGLAWCILICIHIGCLDMRQQKARETSPVRMRPADKKYVEKLARQKRATQTEVLHHAVELLKREQQFQEMREAYANLNEAD